MNKIFLVLLSLCFVTACKQVQTQVDSADSAAKNSVEIASAPKDAAINLKGADLIKHNLEATGKLKIDRVEKTPVDSLFAVFLESGEIIYSNDQGDYFLAGDLYQVENKDVVNVTENFRSGQRAALIGKIPAKDTITFKAEGKTKGHIYVFTDVDCYYCQKLHTEVPALNAAGVEVRYLGFPRAGLNSGSFKKIQSAWCANDQQDALTKLKNKQSIPEKLCESDSVAKQYTLGKDVGVRGTPAIITESGELISGYMPAKALLARLGIK